MKKLVTLILSLISLPALCQEEAYVPVARNTVFIEGLGIGGYGSLNYERTVLKVNRFDFNLRVGFSTYHLKDFTNSFNPDVIVPLTAGVMYGNNHHIELGGGRIFTSVTSFNGENAEPQRDLEMNSTFFVGYRYQRDTGGFIFRATYSPLFTTNVRWTWGGISVGYAF
ncbi:MAG: hypothetical protein V4616_08680 [Bacteroidota bacterium]